MKYEAYRAHKKRNKYLIPLLIMAALMIASATIFAGVKYLQSITWLETPSTAPILTLPKTADKTAPTPVPLPEAKDLSVPYAAQAPFGNWTIHEESCEEAAISMYKGFLDQTSYPNGRMPDAEIDPIYKRMKSWEASHYGKEPDLTMTALGAFANSYYGYKPVVEKEISADNIKKALAAGHPVVVPVMTHSLQNKMYGPVSVYHVLLIKGYDATGVITNDAGVGNGLNMHYNWDILFAAIDAQTTRMNQGRELLYLTK